MQKITKEGPVAADFLRPRGGRAEALTTGVTPSTTRKNKKPKITLDKTVKIGYCVCERGETE